MAKIVVTISPAGEATFKVVGTHGPACTELTRAMEKALGVVKNRHHTSEFYQAAQTNASTETKEVA